ncbi:MAG TPA: peptidoglycan editing factor PgeF [Stellaceae bacterium]|nr:peptidoglycan editing factor PgeF [Stellaceae bacterium]
MITAEILAAPGIRHGFFTREGGVSEGIFASLNCGYGSLDEPEKVAENRARVAEALAVDASRLVTCYQIHSTEVVDVALPWTRETAPRADGMVTTVPGLALGVLAADCAPVLLADAEARVIGACHAGWRGAVHGIVDATVDAMVRKGARRERLRAVVGPCIGKASYEVGPEFRERFLADGADNADLFVPAPRADRFLFDLTAYVLRRLERLGLRKVATTGGDTAGEPTRFFSYRRACWEHDRTYGRLISAIALEP